MINSSSKLQAKKHNLNQDVIKQLQGALLIPKHNTSVFGAVVHHYLHAASTHFLLLLLLLLLIIIPHSFQ